MRTDRDTDIQTDKQTLRRQWTLFAIFRTRLKILYSVFKLLFCALYVSQTNSDYFFTQHDLVFVTKTDCVYIAVPTESLNVIHVNYSLQRVQARRIVIPIFCHSIFNSSFRFKHARCSLNTDAIRMYIAIIRLKMQNLLTCLLAASSTTYLCAVPSLAEFFRKFKINYSSTICEPMILNQALIWFDVHGNVHRGIFLQ